MANANFKKTGVFNTMSALWVLLLLASVSVLNASAPTAKPTLSPTRNPTLTPTRSPTLTPTRSPTRTPTAMPTATPSSSKPTAKPTAVPTSAPTAIPTPINAIPHSDIPIAMHQLVVVQSADSSVIRLKAFDLNSFNIEYKISSLPTSGTLYQLSQVYSSYGYEPKAGEKVTAADTIVTGSNNRIYYKRPSPDADGLNKWDSFTYTAVSAWGIPSYPGTVTLVPPSGNIVGSGFLLGNEEWTLSGNKAVSVGAAYEPYSRGALLNHYIMGSDDKVNVQGVGGADQSLWYFVAPAKFLGNVGIAYGGTIQFSLASFSGDFSKLNPKESYVVLLECAECQGPVTKGITLGYSMAAMAASPTGPFSGAPLRVTVPLKEGRGWLKDSQNSLVPWTAASQCDVIQVLSRLSAIRILGDWTAWYETVALDDVRISNTQGQLPLCAMSRPDASICTC